MMENELVGIDSELEEVEEWIKNWNSESKNGLLLQGPPGVGKTSSVYHVCDKLNRKVVEYNASDKRDKDFLSKLESSTKTTSLGKKRVFLLDEVDGLVKTSSSSEKKLSNIVYNSKNPIIFTANEPWKLGQLRQYCSELRFYKPDLEDVVENAEKEGVEDFSNMIRDQRQAKMKKYGSEGYDDDSRKEKVQKIMNGNFEEFDEKFTFDLLEKTEEFYGMEKFWFIRGLILSRTTGSSYPLKTALEQNVY